MRDDSASDTASRTDGLARLFAANLRACREALGIPRELLARRAGYTANYVMLLEAGRRFPKGSTVAMLAAALGLAPSTLLARQSQERLGIALRLIARCAASALAGPAPFNAGTRQALCGTDDPVMALRHNVAQSLRYWRAKRGLSRDALSEATGDESTFGLDSTSIARIEKAQRDVRLVTLGRLAAALQVEPAALVRGQAEHDDETRRHALEQIHDLALKTL